MDTQRLSSRYMVRNLTEQDIDKIYELSVGNPLYYQHSPPFVANYPNKETVFIGFFMMNKSLQGLGIGSSIIENCGSYFKSEGYNFARLAYAKSNPQSGAFWRKNGFMDTGIECQSGGNTVVILQKNL